MNKKRKKIKYHIKQRPLCCMLKEAAMRCNFCLQNICIVCREVGGMSNEQRSSRFSPHWLAGHCRLRPEKKLQEVAKERLC